MEQRTHPFFHHAEPYTGLSKHTLQAIKQDVFTSCLRNLRQLQWPRIDPGQLWKHKDEISTNFYMIYREPPEHQPSHLAQSPSIYILQYQENGKLNWHHIQDEYIIPREAKAIMIDAPPYSQTRDSDATCQLALSISDALHDIGVHAGKDTIIPYPHRFWAQDSIMEGIFPFRASRQLQLHFQHEVTDVIKDNIKKIRSIIPRYGKYFRFHHAIWSRRAMHKYFAIRTTINRKITRAFQLHFSAKGEITWKLVNHREGRHELPSQIYSRFI